MIILDQHVLFMESNVQAWVCGVVSLTLRYPRFPFRNRLAGYAQFFSQFLLREPMLFSQCCNLRRQFQNILPFLFFLTLPNTAPFDHQPALSFCQPMVAYNCFKLFLASSIAERTYHYDRTEIALIWQRWYTEVKRF